MKKIIMILGLPFLLAQPSEVYPMGTGEDELSHLKTKAKVRVPDSSQRERKVSSNNRAQEEDVELRKGKGGKNTGGATGGHHWSIFWKSSRAGKAYINLVNHEPLGIHPSLQVFLNKKSQGKGIGRIAYRKACEMSRYNSVYAYMSKKNIASRRAAIAAGFVQILAQSTRQMLMRWTRTER